MAEQIRATFRLPLPPEDFLWGARSLLSRRHATNRDIFLTLNVIFASQLAERPLSVPLMWLAAFMALRHHPPHPQLPAWMTAFGSVSHPLFQDWTPQTVQRKVRCHTPTKTSNDPFADAFAAFVQQCPRHTEDDKRNLFVVCALVQCRDRYSCWSFFGDMARSSVERLYNVSSTPSWTKEGFTPAWIRPALVRATQRSKKSSAWAP